MPGDLNESNAFLVGTWLQLIAMGKYRLLLFDIAFPQFTMLYLEGAYLVYLPQCAVLVMKKFKRDRSFMVPVTCLLFFVAAMTVRIP